MIVKSDTEFDYNHMGDWLHVTQVASGDYVLCVVNKSPGSVAITVADTVLDSLRLWLNEQHSKGAVG